MNLLGIKFHPLKGEYKGVYSVSVSRLLNGHIGISLEMALRLSKFFGNSIEIWVNLQAQYDVWCVQH